MMRKILHVAGSRLELELFVSDDGFHAQVRQVMGGSGAGVRPTIELAPVVLQGDVPWSNLRQEDKPNDKVEGQAAPAIATIDEAHTFSEGDAQAAHEGLSRDADRRSGRYE